MTNGGRQHELVRLLPVESGELLYRITSKGEAFERVAKESELWRRARLSTRMASGFAERGHEMGRKKPTARAEFVLFNVLYEDGTVTSNRKVPSTSLCGLGGDALARDFIEAQDREILERSGRARAPIKSISRAFRKPTTSFTPFLIPAIPRR